MAVPALGDLYELDEGTFEVVEIVCGTDSYGIATTSHHAVWIETVPGTPLYSTDLTVFVLQGQGALSAFFAFGVVHACWGREYLSPPTLLPQERIEIVTAWAPGLITGPASTRVDLVELWVTPETTGLERVWRLVPGMLLCQCVNLVDGKYELVRWNPATDAYESLYFDLNRYADGDYRGHAPTSYVDELRAYCNQEYVVIEEGVDVAIPDPTGTLEITGVVGDEVYYAAVGDHFSGTPNETIPGGGVLTIPNLTSGRYAVKIVRPDSQSYYEYLPYREYVDVVTNETTELAVPTLETASTTKTSWHIMSNEGGAPVAGVSIYNLELESPLWDEIFVSWNLVGTTDANGRIDINAPNPGNDFEVVRGLWMVDAEYGVLQLANSDLHEYGGAEVVVGGDLCSWGSFCTVWSSGHLPSDLPGYYNFELDIETPENIEVTSENAFSGWRTVAPLMKYLYVEYVYTGEPNGYPHTGILREYGIKLKQTGEILVSGTVDELMDEFSQGVAMQVGGKISGIAWDQATPSGDYPIRTDLGPEQLARMGAEHGELCWRAEQIYRLAMDGEDVQWFGSVDGAVCPRCGWSTWFRPDRGAGTFRRCYDETCFLEYGSHIDASGYFTSYPIMRALDADDLDVPWTTYHVRPGTRAERTVTPASIWTYPPRYDPDAGYDEGFVHFRMGNWDDQAWTWEADSTGVPYYLGSYGLSSSSPALVRPKIYVHTGISGGEYSGSFNFLDPSATSSMAFSIAGGSGEETYGVGKGTVVYLSDEWYGDTDSVLLSAALAPWDEPNDLLLVKGMFSASLVSGGGANESWIAWADTPAIIFVPPPVRDKKHTPYAIMLPEAPGLPPEPGSSHSLALCNVHCKRPTYLYEASSGRLVERTEFGPPTTIFYGTSVGMLSAHGAYGGERHLAFAGGADDDRHVSVLSVGNDTPGSWLVLSTDGADFPSAAPMKPGSGLLVVYVSGGAAMGRYVSRVPSTVAATWSEGSEFLVVPTGHSLTDRGSLTTNPYGGHVYSYWTTDGVFTQALVGVPTA